MKNWTWKQWTSLALIVVTVLTCFIMHLVQPTITYAFAEVMTLIGAIIGFIAGYLFKRDKKQTQVSRDDSTQIQI